jgi:hypothetical protein
MMACIVFHNGRLTCHTGKEMEIDIGEERTLSPDFLQNFLSERSMKEHFPQDTKMKKMIL